MTERDPRACDHFEDVADILARAEQQASTAWEMSFVADQIYRHDRWGGEMRMSAAQAMHLRRIAGEHP